MPTNKESDSAHEMDFLAGGGELGRLMRGLEWARTPLGPPQHWPHSLRTSVRIMLASRQPIWIGWGPDLIYLYNDPYKSIIGGKHPWALGRPTAEVWHEIWGDIAPMLETALSGEQGTYVEAQLLIMNRHGYPEETYYTFSYSPIPNDDGSVGGIFCANTDDTRRVIGERQLSVLREVSARTAQARSAEDVCRGAVEALGEDRRDIPFALIYLPDDEGAALALRGAAGISRDHAAVPNALSSGDDERWPVKQLIATGDLLCVPAPVAETSPLPAGAWASAPNQLALVPIKLSGEGERCGALIVGLNPFRLLDESYRSFLDLVAGQIAAALGNAAAYEQERRRAAALAEIDRAKTTFFSNVSHEFRTPLTLIRNPVEELLGSEPLDSRTHDLLVLVHRNTVRLQKLVNNLLDFSRIEAGRMTASYELTDLAAATRDIASTFRSAMERAELAFSVDCAALESPVYVDRDMWEKVVLNLVSNAFKFTLQGSVTVRLGQEGGWAVLTVTDSGSGIPAHELPRLFERFHRIEGTQARTHEGSGIGLALVHELVRLHGGSIAVSSELGRGTTCSVRIPFGSQHLPQDQVCTARKRTTSGAANAYLEEALRWLPAQAREHAELGREPIDSDALPGLGALAGTHILLADDNADMRQYVSDLLSPYLHVTAVADGEAALRHARSSPPDLVLTDVMMPRMDGFALLRALHADPALAAIPVILLSARAGEEAAVEGFAAGADDYLVKPFSSRELVARVAGSLKLARLRREAADRLRASEERFRAVQEASPDGFTVLEAVRDASGKIVDFSWVYCNGAAAKIAGRSREALIGKRVMDVHPGNLAAGLFDRYVEVTTTGVPWIAELHYQHDGIDAMVRLSVARVGDGVAISTVDISERHRAEQALREADQRKDEFLAILAHELRNPLAPVRYAAAMLQPGVSPAIIEKARATIERQSGHLARLLDDLLDLSRITRNRISLRVQTLDLRASIEQAIELARPAAAARDHEVTFSVPVEPVWVDADGERILQVIGNLLSNAIKYTQAHGRIEISLRRSARDVVLAVQDNGLGFEPHQAAHLFALFSQLHRGSSDSAGGLGIGLAVVRQLVALHHGTVEARSPGPHQGATFEVRLPAAAAPRKSESAAGNAGEIVPLYRTRRVLVVDDSIDTANSLAMVLRSESYAVYTAHSGLDGLQTADAVRPDLVLLDIGLPDMSGYEVARELRRRAWAVEVRIFAVSGWATKEDIERSRSAGIDIHLAKPVDPKRLLWLMETQPEATVAAARPK